MLPSYSFTCKRGHEVHLIFSTLQSSEEVKSFDRTSVARKGKAEIRNLDINLKLLCALKELFKYFSPCTGSVFPQRKLLKLFS